MLQNKVKSLKELADEILTHYYPKDSQTNKRKKSDLNIIEEYNRDNYLKDNDFNIAPNKFDEQERLQEAAWKHHSEQNNVTYLVIQNLMNRIGIFVVMT